MRFLAPKPNTKIMISPAKTGVNPHTGMTQQIEPGIVARFSGVVFATDDDRTIHAMLLKLVEVHKSKKLAPFIIHHEDQEEAIAILKELVPDLKNPKAVVQKSNVEQTNGTGVNLSHDEWHEPLEYDKKKPKAQAGGNAGNDGMDQVVEALGTVVDAISKLTERMDAMEAKANKPAKTEAKKNAKADAPPVDPTAPPVTTPPGETS